jgi:hypothetical protein
VSFICYGAILLKGKLGYDDSLDVFGVHGVGGAFGALAVGLFAKAGISGDVNGLFNLTVNAQPGGDGGHATATGGKGGNDNACPGKVGGKGGKATANGGLGGDASTSLAGGTAGGLNDGPGGNGGNATVNAGKGGNGMGCCDNPPKKGGDGSKGGDAIAKPGDPGNGQPLGAPGLPFGQAGDGGNGGDGLPPGKGGAMGIGTRVPNGAPGVDGKPCGGGGGGGGACIDEKESNDLEETATPMPDLSDIGQELCGTGSLSDMSDKDHFVITLAVGTYEVSVAEKPAMATDFFLDIGGGNGSTRPIGAPATITVTEPMTHVWIGFFGGSGTYKFAIKRIE